ncbi:MAG TPA: hypothetical protein DD417_07890, partial [Elusimicrobia bacterium]|nr:hypothetical protein [Elusimicrobiota bacterium]
LAKPFSPAELLARAKAVLRRTMNKPQDPGLLSIGPLRIAPEAHQVFLFDRELLLRPKEYNLLMAFLETRGRVLSRRALLQAAWGLDKELELDTNVVDVTVGSLRRKLGAYGRCIVSVHSVGFRFDPERLPVPPAPPGSAELGTDPKKRRR